MHLPTKSPILLLLLLLLVLMLDQKLNNLQKII